jgi:UDP-glucuronate 4-epimerase
MKKARILVTGAAGFIGSRLVNTIKAIPDFAGSVIEYDLKRGDDTRDYCKLSKTFEAYNFDLVIHLAALAGVRAGEDFPEDYYSTNILGTQYVVNCCQKYGVKNLIFYSSSSVLGGNRVENSVLLPLTESHYYYPKSVYAISKVAGENIVTNSGLDYGIIRPFTVYGESGRQDMVIYRWINQLKAGKNITFYGDGQSQRGYTYVQDLIDGTIMLANKLLAGELKQELFHLGGSEVITLKNLLDLFIEHASQKNIAFEVDRLPMHAADVVSSFASIDKAKRLLGFTPEPRFRELVKNILSQEL